MTFEDRLAPEHRKVWRYLAKSDRHAWRDFAYGCGWTPPSDPEWMDDDHRRMFWAEVAIAERDAKAAREVARIREQLAESFSPLLLRLAAVLGWVESKVRRGK